MFGPPDGSNADERLDVFAARFADAVVGPGGSLVDAVIRQAVTGPIIDTLTAPDTWARQSGREIPGAPPSAGSCCARSTNSSSLTA